MTKQEDRDGGKMYKIEDIIKDLTQKSDIRLEDVPDIDLYMDQVLTLFNKYFPYNEGEQALTKTMINNYAKSGVIKPAVKKKYTKEKRRHILIYNFKVYLVMAFCVAVVSMYSKLTGSSNSVVGVTVLLAVLVLRQADFGIRTTHGLLSIAGIFGILMAGPRLANIVPPLAAFAVNAVCILLLMILGCHNVIMYNHSTFVLGYLLLLGYDVTGKEYTFRVIGLLVGMVICMIVFYKNQRNRAYRRTFLDLFREFDLKSARSRWYVKLTLIVSSAMLFMNLLGLPRAMWAGIACMSVCLPFTEDCVPRSVRRGMFNVVGCLLFIVLYLVLPESMYPYIGMIGGIGVGYSAGYPWQTAFNTFGALSIAAGIFGMPAAVALRIGANVLGAAYTVICNKVTDKVAEYIGTNKCAENLS